MTPAPIPKTAPFDDDQIDLLNRVVGPASATQRAWLAGFLAGLEASAAVPQPAAPPASSEPLTIVFASESGNSEKLAGDMAKAARKNRLKPTIIDMADLDVAELASAKRVVFIAATWGEGEPPSRSARAYAELMGEKAPRLDGVEFGVLALGDTAYVEFCAVGRAIDERLATLGAKRVVERPIAILILPLGPQSGSARRSRRWRPRMLAAARSSRSTLVSRLRRRRPASSKSRLSSTSI